jgi:LysM repeat protein
VQAGDILSTVAQKTGVPVDRLRELNPGLDANAMTVGQQIRLAP